MIPRLTAFTALPLFVASVFSTSALAAIYGADDRREAHSDARMALLARSTAVMISPVYTSAGSSGQLNLDFPPLSESAYGVCRSERFANQPTANIACTGFLVAPDLLATAGHCMVNVGSVTNENNAYCSDFIWLFDYRAEEDGSVQLQGIEAERIARCKRVVFATLEYDYDARTGHYVYHRDFALIQLDRPVEGRAPLRLSNRAPRAGDRVSKIGYPNGLPAKTVTGAKVLDVSDPNYFRSNLDIIDGDSGGPVLNDLNEVVGITVRAFPQQDYFEDPANSCMKPNRCDEHGNHCSLPQTEYPTGAHVQRIADLLPWLVR